jgi:hypothetical protein
MPITIDIGLIDFYSDYKGIAAIPAQFRQVIFPHSTAIAYQAICRDCRTSSAPIMTTEANQSNPTTCFQSSAISIDRALMLAYWLAQSGGPRLAR